VNTKKSKKRRRQRYHHFAQAGISNSASSGRSALCICPVIRRGGYFSTHRHLCDRAGLPGYRRCQQSATIGLTTIAGMIVMGMAADKIGNKVTMAIGFALLVITCCG